MLAGDEGRAPLTRRHYLRVSAEPHAGLDRRIDSLVRQAGLSVQNRATRTDGDVVSLGYVVSESTMPSIDAVRTSVARLARAREAIVLGVQA